MVILNLPRSIRYKFENVVVVGVIPGPKEPALTLNSYLGPLVQELNELWHGTHVQVNGESLFIKAALAFIACDIPASRKVSGFLGHAACLGCSRCLKKFEHIDKQQCCGGFDRTSWPKRTNEDHRKACQSLVKPKSKKQLHDMEMNLGVRYSILLELEYLDIVKSTLIDPMHNLLLGTAKYMLKLWIDKGILNSADIEKIEKKVLHIKCPLDIGRLPLKIGSGFSGFTASQWRYWVTVYSPIALKGILPNAYLNPWLLYVKACRTLCAQSVSHSDLITADKQLEQFCKCHEQLFGSGHCTMNMHLHLHLKECIEEFGPSPTFWCFSLERFNGILGSYQVSRGAIHEAIS